MKRNPLFTGTIRGRQGNRHIVAMPDGSSQSIKIVSDHIPPIGADIIGRVSEGDQSDITLHIVDNVVDDILKSENISIMPFGDSDVTARLLSTILKGAAPAILKPGEGGIIERTCKTNDPDLKWALDAFIPVGKSLGVALNVLDPLSTVSSSWGDKDLVRRILPADASGENTALLKLKEIIAGGFNPVCSKTLFQCYNDAQIPSVDFIIPYSPFDGAVDFVGKMGGGWRDEFPTILPDLSEIRKFSAFREMSLALSYRFLGKHKNIHINHQKEQIFADVAACLALMQDSKSENFSKNIAKMRNNAVARSASENGDIPVLSSSAIHAAINYGVTMFSMDGKFHVSTEDILKAAVSITNSYSPKSEKDLKFYQTEASDMKIFIPISSASKQLRGVFQKKYSQDISNVLNRLPHEVAKTRFINFSAMSIPVSFEEIFDKYVKDIECIYIENDIKPFDF